MFEPHDDYQQCEQVTLLPALLDLEDDSTLTIKALSWGQDEKELDFTDSC